MNTGMQISNVFDNFYSSKKVFVSFRSSFVAAEFNASKQRFLLHFHGSSEGQNFRSRDAACSQSRVEKQECSEKCMISLFPFCHYNFLTFIYFQDSTKRKLHPKSPGERQVSERRKKHANGTPSNGSNLREKQHVKIVKVRKRDARKSAQLPPGVTFTSSEDNK